MIITNILDTDLYKFTTSYAYIKLFPYVTVRILFIQRIFWLRCGMNWTNWEEFVLQVKKKILW